jgi:hypothetical protein
MQSGTNMMRLRNTDFTCSFVRQKGASLVYWWSTRSESNQNPVRLRLRLCSVKTTRWITPVTASGAYAELTVLPSGLTSPRSTAYGRLRLDSDTSLTKAGYWAEATQLFLHPRRRLQRSFNPKGQIFLPKKSRGGSCLRWAWEAQNTYFFYILSQESMRWGSFVQTGLG